MEHFIERVPNGDLRGHDKVLYRSLGKGDVLLASTVLLVFAPVCYLKGVPHDSMTVVAVASFLIGVLLLLWGGTKCELTFRRAGRTLEVRWILLGAEVSVQECKFENLRLSIRWRAVFSGGSRGAGVGVPRPWLALTATKAVFLFQRPLGVIVSEKDLPLLLSELGISSDPENHRAEPTGDSL